MPYTRDELVTPIPEIRRLSPEENRNPNTYHSQYYVLSSNGHTVYTVSKLQNWMGDVGTGWECSCRGWTMHVPRRDCRHIAKARDFAARGEPRESVARRSLRDIAIDARAAAEEEQHVLMEGIVRNHFELHGTTFYICMRCGWTGANPAAAEHEVEADHHEWEYCATLDSALRAIVEHRELIERGGAPTAPPPLSRSPAPARRDDPADPQVREHSSCRHERRARMFIDGKWERCGVCQVVVPAGA